VDHVDAGQSGGFGKINIPRLNENSGAYLPNNIQSNKVSPYTPIQQHSDRNIDAGRNHQMSKTQINWGGNKYS
jgi:hypothetical protein